MDARCIRPVARFLGVLVVLAGMAGCSDSSPGGAAGPPGGGDGRADTGTSGGGGQTDATPQTGDDAQGGDRETGGGTGSGDGGPPSPPPAEGLDLGEICDDDVACGSRLCFFFDPTIEEGFCSQLCFQNEDCNGGDGFRCIFLANSGQDFVRLCVPNNLCIDRDGDGYGAGPACQGPDCDDSNPDVNPGVLEVCDGLDNNCDGNVDVNTVDANVDCDTGFPGVCQPGRVQCLSGVPLCVADRSQQPEICDGVDNDCDGLVDEGDDGLPLRTVCYGGPAGTEGVGACQAGARVCEGGLVSECLGQVLPQVEVCDGVDNDCDGEVDEGSPGAGQPCDVPGQTGPCARGRTQCDAEGTLICAQLVFPVAELCDGIDNDCNGLVDDAPAGGLLQRVCFGGEPEQRGVGACRDGLQTCTAADWGLCEGQVLPSPELCDSIDNNCNGEVDEGAAAGGFVCATGQLGACAVGTTVCTAEGSVCQPSRTPSAEICDGIDNDCNGQVDEGPGGQPLSRDCYGGPAGSRDVGVCRGGVQTCGPDGFGFCVGEVRPGLEVCDGVDNDCDGAVDEGNPGGGVSCTTGLPGVCATGTTACTGGEVRCQGSIAPGTRTEICDGLDNNCNGTIDEGFPGLGTGCTAGLGICARPGVVVCSPDGTSAPVCNATPGTPAPVESCTYVDDNCNGQVDEGFRDANGRYTTVPHCGACGADCNLRWPGGAAAFNVIPTCTASGATAVCGFTCAAGFLDADGVADNGCEFQPEPQTVYVSTPINGGVDNGTCGAWNAPCATIQQGIDRAQATGRTRVRVSTGLYEGNIMMRNGISVLGGHSNLNWVRNPSVFGTTLRGADVAGVGAGTNDRIAVQAIGISGTTELSGFVIVGINAGPGGNSIGIYVRNSDAGLRIENNEVIAGAGGNGATGAAGSAGSAGQGGGAGNPNVVQRRGSPAVSAGPGGAGSCGGVQVSGGRGGAGVQPTWNGNIPVFGESGTAGAGPAAGSGGSAGAHLHGLASSCSVANNAPIAGNPGTPGSAGADGAGGAGASNINGSVASGQWRGVSGGNGNSGGPGSGGGGGGAPAGVRNQSTSTTADDHFGASSGGGGAGGCQGNGGQGGQAGGASIAIAVGFDVAPANLAAFPTVSGNRLRRGLGGRGGDGGTGGGGGQGGAGGDGGSRVVQGSWDWCIQNGSSGGNGGRGGHGGGGGGGAGGISFDLYLWGTNGLNPSYQGANSFEISNTTPTGGLGGTGGNSSNTIIGIGGNGATGNSGHQRRIN
jgi:hypothetical protein